MNNEEFAIKTRLRKKISKVLRNYPNRINYLEISKHLGSCPGNIENYHIDHIFPLCAFDFNNPIHIKAAFAPENHQWLEKSKNMSKKGYYNLKDFKEYLRKFDPKYTNKTYYIMERKWH